MNLYFPPSFQYRFRLLLLYLLLIFPVSALLPYRFAFENGPIENAQAAILLGGALLCIRFSHVSLPSIHRMWLAVSGLFLLLSLRELSWGRVFFVERYTTDGPVILPAAEMPFYWEIHTAAGLLAAACLYGLIRCTPWRQIFHEFPLPRCATRRSKSWLSSSCIVRCVTWHGIIIFSSEKGKNKKPCCFIQRGF